MMFKDSGLKDKVVVITGGARGNGRSIVKLLAEEGADVNFLYNSSKSLADELEQEAKNANQKVQGFAADVRNKEQCQSVIEKIYEKNQRIDILVNNSGVVRDNLLAALSDDDIQTVIDTNLIGTLNMTQAVIPFMMRQRSGKIINISSVAGSKPGRGQANYAATKGAINAVTKALAVELAPRNIIVNAIAPGVIETDMSKDVRDLAGDQVLSKILLKRYGQPEEIAYAVAFLASKYANYITGEILYVDGGFKME